MTETRTDRLDLPLWGAGSDSGSRSDFNEAMTKINDRAAWDDGVTQNALPGTDLIPGRYQLVVHSGTYRVVYRRHDGGGWDAVGGNTMPNPFHFRGIAAGVNRTDAAVTFSHPDAANVGGTIGYDGSALLSGTVRVFDDDEAGRGALLVGTDATPNLTTLGRTHVRTRAVGERALTVQAHASNAGNLFTARTAGESDVLSVDALGRLRALAPSAFGGAPLPTLASLAVAPTASDDDDTTAGLLLHGSTGSAEITAKAIMRILRQSDDAAPLAEFLRDSFAIGRLPWTGSAITLAATGHTVRAGGINGNSFYWRLRRSDPTSSATEGNAANDVTLFGITETGSTHNLPMVITNRYRTAPVALTVQRITDFSAGFLSLARLVPDGGGGETSQSASIWDSDGRLRTGAWWRSTGTTRDARQAVHHICRKVYAAPGDPSMAGIELAPSAAHTLTWTSMTARSSGTTDLRISVTVELMLGWNAADNEADAQVYSARTLVSVNGGSFTEIGNTENAQATPLKRAGSQRLAGDLLVYTHRLTNVPSGATFQIRTVFTNGSAAPTAWLRSLEVDAEECVIESYAAP
jgi:hypothetical protein